MALWVPLESLSRDVFSWLSEGVANPSPFPSSYLLADRVLFCPLPQLLIFYPVYAVYLEYFSEAVIDKGLEFVGQSVGDTPGF